MFIDMLVIVFCFLMIRRPPRSTRTDTLFPYTTLFRSSSTTLRPFGPRVALTALARVLTPRTIFARASSPKRISLADMAVTSEAGMGNKGNGERRVAGVGRTTGIGQRRRVVPHSPHSPHSRCSGRSEEHQSALQSLMRISFAVFCLKKNNN